LFFESQSLLTLLFDSKPFIKSWKPSAVIMFEWRSSSYKFMRCFEYKSIKSIIDWFVNFGFERFRVTIEPSIGPKSLIESGPKAL
jgi:hypothetical protein